MILVMDALTAIQIGGRLAERGVLD